MTQVLGASEMVHKLAEQAVQDQGKNTTAKQADPTDVERFDSALQKQNVDPANTIQNTPEIARSELNQQSSPQVGEKILENMQRVQEGHNARVENINSLLGGEDSQPLSIKEGMRLQYEVMQLNLQEEITTKVSDKSSQGVQTLFKNQ